MLASPVLRVLVGAGAATWAAALWPVLRDRTSWGFRLWWAWHRRFRDKQR
ncbi:hypothetical protein [Goodfellowiella coeruleoviolacea]|uniref:Uncharacterized protein n=1 Tax=Goodfellowiella coeruleoviolacea TaxID=334858 RepID=A0AAE3GL10_9PSEU|nr:hypothetical protein [Goodfellowiella coeruleoviolacea]MCP2167998.1 hypothetical protein [Goodfellowiella coeruleoviolacea]